MKFARFFIASTATAILAASVFSQDDGLDVEDLFDESFEETETVTINDPFQGFNRVVFKFNDHVYSKVARPLIKTYSRVMPDPAEKGIRNFFENIKFPSRFVGNVLQGRFKAAGKETGKFFINTTAGLAGFMRPSDKFDGLQTSDEDIGQAMASWGIGHGFYLILPFMGPTSLRDFVADIADDAVEPLPKPYTQVSDASDRFTLRIVELVNNMPLLLELYESMNRAAIDPYASVRDAYAQRRARQVAK